MSRIEKTINIEAPIEDVYAQWTQFEQFPRFMDGVESVVHRRGSRRFLILLPATGRARLREGKAPAAGPAPMHPAATPSILRPSRRGGKSQLDRPAGRDPRRAGSPRL